jgi:hypothetical protein
MPFVFDGILNELFRTDFIPHFCQVDQVVLDPFAKHPLQLRSVPL